MRHTKKIMPCLFLMPFRLWSSINECMVSDWGEAIPRSLCIHWIPVVSCPVKSELFSSKAWILISSFAVNFPSLAHYIYYRMAKYEYEEDGEDAIMTASFSCRKQEIVSLWNNCQPVNLGMWSLSASRFHLQDLLARISHSRLTFEQLNDLPLPVRCWEWTNSFVIESVEG